MPASLRVRSRCPIEIVELSCPVVRSLLDSKTTSAVPREPTLRETQDMDERRSRIRRIVPLCIAATGAMHAPVARGDLIFGLNVSSTPTTGIYLVNTVTRTSTLYRATTRATTGSNALAYDRGSDTFYYVTDMGATNHLIRNRPGQPEVDMGAMTSTASLDAATFYNGSYWTQANSSAGIIRVSFPGGGFVEQFNAIPGYPNNVNYGDIASDPSGVTFASQSGGLRRYNLNSLGAGSVPLANTPVMQLAFGPSGLFGMSGGTIYSVSTTTGVATPLGGLINRGLSFIDLATAPAPGAGVVLGLGAMVAGRRKRSV